MDTCSVRGDTVSQTNVLSFARINVIYLPELGGQLPPPLTPVSYAYVVSVQQLPVTVPTLKWPRMLASSASAVRRLMKKAELLGVNSQVRVNSRVGVDSQMKVNVCGVR